MKPSASARRLLLVRHAKSAWPEVADHDRPLAPRGRRQAPLVARWLRDEGYRPDLVLCSTARRAVETWQLMADELDAGPQVSEDGRIYGAAGSTLLDMVRQTPPAVTTLLLVGHDPGIPDLARSLAADAGAARNVARPVWAKFPTGAVAVLAIAGAWGDLDPGAARLTDFVVPRDLER